MVILYIYIYIYIGEILRTLHKIFPIYIGTVLCTSRKIGPIHVWEQFYVLCANYSNVQGKVLQGVFHQVSTVVISHGNKVSTSAVVASRNQINVLSYINTEQHQSPYWWITVLQCQMTLIYG